MGQEGLADAIPTILLAVGLIGSHAGSLSMPNPSARRALSSASCRPPVLGLQRHQRRSDSQQSKQFRRERLCRKRYGGPLQCWGVIWSLISLVFMICGIVAGIAAFRNLLRSR